MMTLCFRRVLKAAAQVVALLGVWSLWPRSAEAAPPGAPVVHIVELWANSAKGLENNHKAQVLTSALRDYVVNADEFFLNTENPLLLSAALGAKCDTQAFTDVTLTESSDRGMDKACLERMAKRMGARAFFWGYLFAGEGGRLSAKLHLWQQGDDRVAVLPYDEKNPRRLAERLYRHLVAPAKVGDVRLLVEGPTLRGELVVNGRSYGPWEAQGVELTLPTGELTAEIRSGDKALARGKGVVAVSGVKTMRLAPVAEPALPSRVAPPEPATSVVVVERTSALPWVFGGIGAAGLVGAGVFLALRQDAKSELKDACQQGTCPPPRADTIDRGNLYGTLSLVSLGVGLVGAGLATYVVLDAPSSSRSARAPALRWVGGVQPIAGGMAAGLAGSF
jgi:hypothetical protein